MGYGVRASRGLSRRAQRVVPLVFTGLGVMLLIGAVVVALLLGRGAADRTASTTAVVVEVTERTSQSRDSDGNTRTSTTYCPVVEYTVDGETFTHESAVCTGSREGNRVGDELTVNYDPADPADAAIDSWLHRWLAPLIMGGIGGVFVLIGSVTFAAARAGKLDRTRRAPMRGREPDSGSTGPAPAFHRPDFPPAREGTVGYDTGAVDMLVARVEHAYRQIAGGQRPDLTAEDLTTTTLVTTGTPGTGYDTATVDMYLASVRNDLERLGGQ
ncbi:DUF3592 domain-containing protein [Haloechinothrix sp. LS1_15]|uniref:DUF3592 domain-containing protein n=1 Tax=Haloechinothrix sp. LS1_15 TaxID=2652248 RepID=UPI00294444D2|nr:DUF3592 domain-containing protein [Haloechinothrix sp. LS1_15]MDV6013311.1 DUF3592 domain-containing protein [Haloechinothrix sp. LS1_15]